MLANKDKSSFVTPLLSWEQCMFIHRSEHPSQGGVMIKYFGHKDEPGEGEDEPMSARKTKEPEYIQ